MGSDESAQGFPLRAGMASPDGWDGAARTRECRSQSPVPYHLATSQSGNMQGTGTIPNPLTWGGIWGSNPRHPEPQSGALPTELIPPYCTRVGSGAGAPGGTRTPGLLLRRQLLYPAELLAHIVPATNANNHQITAQHSGFDLERRKEITDVQLSLLFRKPRKRNGVNFFRRWSG